MKLAFACLGHQTQLIEYHLYVSRNKYLLAYIFFPKIVISRVKRLI